MLRKITLIIQAFNLLILSSTNINVEFFGFDTKLNCTRAYVPSTLPSDTIAVTPHLTYINWNDTSIQPLAFATVHVVDNQGNLLYDINGTLGEVVTDANGDFTFGPIYAPGGLLVNLKIYSRKATTPSQMVSLFTYGLSYTPKPTTPSENSGTLGISVAIRNSQPLWRYSKTP